jgi:hypothetical protein
MADAKLRFDDKLTREFEQVRKIINDEAEIIVKKKKRAFRINKFKDRINDLFCLFWCCVILAYIPAHFILKFW